jgi:hypothetical protein
MKTKNKHQHTRGEVTELARETAEVEQYWIATHLFVVRRIDVRRIALEHRPSALASTFGSRREMGKLSTISVEPLYSARRAPQAVDRTTSGSAREA